MSGTSSAITYGSIIHLQNTTPNGGYLDVSGWISEQYSDEAFQDPRRRAGIATHATPNRLFGSGSWQILSAQGKRSGDAVKFGDNVYLRSMRSGAGYAGGLNDLTDASQATYVALTTVAPMSGGSLFNTWTIQAADKDAEHKTLSINDTIHLKLVTPNGERWLACDDVASCGKLSTS